MNKSIFFPFQTLGLTLLLVFVTAALYSQSPQGIPYQAVVRNADGSVMSNAAVNMIFKIHNGTATGSVVYEESHALTSNTQGLVSCVVGNGIVSQGNFGNIPWGSGAKFLQVLMGTTELGTQQMMSVPYALYSNGVNVRVSSVGDTLVIGGQSVIVPGISAANVSNNGMPTSGLGAVVLPGNATCADQFISVSGCNGQTSLTYDGRTYDLVEIGGQCWFADNLATDQYRNGDLIPTGLDSVTWTSSSIGAYAIYGNNSTNDLTYGKLYNWYTIIDEKGLCPSGWHIPTDCEWMYLEGTLGMSIQDQELYNYRGNSEGGSLKSTLNWNFPNTGATNGSGFNALPGAYCDIYGKFSNILNYGNWWSSTQGDYSSAWSREIYSNHGGITRGFHDNRNGFSVRCLRDNSQPLVSGCTDASACNFLVNANQDDGSCLYVNATCDDGNANTMNDVIGSDCQCAGTLVSAGGLGSQVLPGNTTCANEYISVTGCGGQTSLTYDGLTYDLVEIGGQCWFADNLATNQYRNGDLIPSVLDNPDWVNITNGVQANYNFSQVTDITYGKLYNWYTTIDSRGLCPSGWHVPTDCEWMYLEDFVGMSESNQESAGWRGNEGGALKSITMWEAPNSGSSNSSGFEGLPGGYLGNGNYFDIGSYGYWWSSSENNSSEAWNRVLAYGYTGIARAGYNKVNVFNIRCLRDEINSQTLGCTDASACNFLVNANQDDGSCLYVNTTCDDGNANTINDVIGSDCQCAGTLVSAGGLGSQVLPGNNTCANEYISVTGCNGETSLTYDGRTYDLVEIGGQCWFADNLATDQYRNGDLIPTGLDNTTWQNTTAGAYAIYNNDPANDFTYGKLYNWFTTVDTRGLCPVGWHVPTDCEWMYLEGSLGMSLSDQSIVGMRGSNQGGVLKSTSGWLSPNFGANNNSGFTALPAGSRSGGYQGLGSYGYWWCSTSNSINKSFGRAIYNFDSIIDRWADFKYMGYSVRCLKD
jgi:uncharacterized protein (TIGR02145 family)